MTILISTKRDNIKYDRKKEGMKGEREKERECRQVGKQAWE